MSACNEWEEWNQLCNEWTKSANTCRESRSTCRVGEKASCAAHDIARSSERRMSLIIGWAWNVSRPSSKKCSMFMTTIEMCRLNSRTILLENNMMENARRWYGADFMVLWSRRDAKSLRTTQNAIFFFHSDSGCEATSSMSFVRLRQSICFMQISLALPSSSISCRAPRRNRTEKIPRFIEFCLRFAVVFIELFNSDYLCLVPRPCLLLHYAPRKIVICIL